MKKIIVLFSLLVRFSPFFLLPDINSLALDTVARVLTPSKPMMTTTAVNSEKILKDIQALLAQMDTSFIKKILNRLARISRF